jgi:hypothetical protein
MIKKILFAAIMLSSFAACNSKSAFNYSQEIVKKERSLSLDINETEDKVKVFLDKEQFDSIAAAGVRMEKLVDARLTEIKDQPVPDVKDGPAFKDAAIRYFKYIKSMYTGYKDFGNASTPEARDKEMTKLRDIVNQKTGALRDMQLAQKKFADANGFKIENN